MWKPIEIKPGDQRYLGEIVVKGRLWELKTVTSPTGRLSFVSKKFAIISWPDDYEEIYDLKEDDTSWFVFEPDPPKKLLAPAILQNSAGFLFVEDGLFGSKKDAEFYYHVGVYKTTHYRVISWPAIPNKDGFYEVPD